MRLNKTIMVLAAAAIGLTNMVQAQKVSCKIKGSDTCLPLTQKFAEVYSKNNAGSNIAVVGGGSGVGLAALLSGTTDIAQSSRSIKMDEKLKMKEAGKAYKETIIAYDALAVVVNPGNKVNQLSREQLESIFTGKVTNWKEVGGADLKIVIYSRESSSGTFEFFKEHVLGKKNFANTALLMPATGAIVQSVGQTPGAIGYIGLAYVDKSVKALRISYDGGKTFIEPLVETAKNKSYPITRPLFYYYPVSVEKAVKPFINFVVSDEGQKIVLAEGYVPVK